MKLKNRKLYSRPISITIETTNRCAFRCEMCPRSADKVRKVGDMTLETFHKIEPFLDGALHVNLSGFGDTLLNKDLFQMLKIIKNYNCYTMVYTNDLLTKDICERVVDSSLDEMVISIDGASQQTYEDIRKNGDFNRLINNIHMLNELKII